MKIVWLSSFLILSILLDGVASMGFVRLDYMEEDCEESSSPTTKPTTAPPTTPTTTTPTTTRTTTTPTTTKPTTTRTTTTPTTTIPSPPPPPRIAQECPVTVANSTLPIPPNSCEAGWTAFRRLTGVRCLRTFVQAVNQSTAASLCVAQNAVLSGIENSNERDWIHEQFRPLVVNISVIRTVWLGATRKPECAILTGFPESCLPKETGMFMWTDTSVTGTDGFCPWWLTDPDNQGGRQVQSCVQMAIIKDATPLTVWNATRGSLDDTFCTIAAPTIIGYVCSKASL